MNLSFTPEQEAFRLRLRRWLAENLPTGWGTEDFPGFASEDDETAFLRDWQARLHRAGWCGLSWPPEYGGAGATSIEQAIYDEETARAQAPELINKVGVNNVGPTLMRHGTEEQKRRFIPKILSAEEIWCQLFSEPGAGSDLAALRTRAEPDGDGFAVSGQKVWTSYAALSDWAILLARTDPSLPKHRGITYFLLDMRSPGITIRPLRQATGSTEFSEVFLDRVRVPREQVVGAVNRGWEIAMTTLAHERGTGFAFKEQVLQRIALEDAIALARGIGRVRDPVVRQEIARRWIDVEIMRLMNCRALTRLERGEEPGPESSLVKLFWAELTQRLHELGLALEGPHGQLAEGRWQQAWLWSRVASIAGGTSEVQANIIAQRLLGLPR